jgi:hypothetical protein
MGKGLDAVPGARQLFWTIKVQEADVALFTEFDAVTCQW